jgi:hypothetical protein
MIRGIRFVTIVIILIQCGGMSSTCFSQETNTDTSFLALSKKKQISLYTTAIEYQSRLYNGSDYIVYQSHYEEHPYFKIDDWATGSIVYWDELYENIPILYDLSTDQVITENRGGHPIKLVAEKVQSFTVSEHTFVRLTREGNNKINDGFYDRLYDGNVKVYARLMKTYRETLNNKEVIPSYTEGIRYYVVKDGIFHTVKTKKSVLQILVDRKQEMKTFVRKNRIRFKNNREVAIVRVIEYYDSLKQ